MTKHNQRGRDKERESRSQRSTAADLAVLGGRVSKLRDV